jgi:hypothetical protein
MMLTMKMSKSDGVTVNDVDVCGVDMGMQSWLMTIQVAVVGTCCC